MIKAFSQALSQLGDVSFRRVIWIGLTGSGVMFVVLWITVGFFLLNTEIFNFDGLLGILNTPIEWMTDIFGAAAVIFLSWLLFPAIVSVIVSFFLEDAAQAGAKHYPNLPNRAAERNGHRDANLRPSYHAEYFGTANLPKHFPLSV